MENNPLKQYFRRPSIYFKLPSDGRYYEPGVVDFPPNRELPVYPMTSADEITIRTSDALFNGAAVVELIRSCIPAIKDPWKINNVDMDAIMIAIRAAGNDGKMEVVSVCPSCTEDAKYDINLINLMSKMQAPEYETTLKLRELEIKFRPLSFIENNQNNVQQFQIQRTLALLDNVEESDEKKQQLSDTIKEMNVLVNKMVGESIEYIKTPETDVYDKQFILEFLSNCDRNTAAIIRDHSISLRQQSEIKPLHVTCLHCQHEYEQPMVLNVTDFFE